MKEKQEKKVILEKSYTHILSWTREERIQLWICGEPYAIAVDELNNLLVAENRTAKIYKISKIFLMGCIVECIVKVSFMIYQSNPGVNPREIKVGTQWDFLYEIVKNKNIDYPLTELCIHQMEDIWGARNSMHVDKNPAHQRIWATNEGFVEDVAKTLKDTIRKFNIIWETLTNSLIESTDLSLSTE